MKDDVVLERVDNSDGRLAHFVFRSAAGSFSFSCGADILDDDYTERLARSSAAVEG